MGAARGFQALASLRWTRTERGCAAAALALLVQALYLGGAALLTRLPEVGRLLDVALLRAQLPVLALLTLAAAGLLATGLRLRRQHPHELRYQYVAALFFALSTIWPLYLTGTLGFAAGAILMGTTLAGYIVLERRVILSAFLAALLLAIGLSLLTALEWLPYAPLLPEIETVEQRLLLVHVNLWLAAPHIVVTIVSIMLIIGEWRAREARALKLSLTDPLTGVHNRRSVLHMLDRLLDAGRPLTLALVDLDHFKQINDRFGHQAGDRVLQAAATALRACLRDSDAIGRFGGEEFLLLLPDTDEADARQVLERCRRELATVTHAVPGQEQTITATFGMASMRRGDVVSATALITAADRALYEAKAAGRNRLMQGEVPPGTTRASATRPPATRTGVSWRQRLQRLAEDGQRWPPVRLNALLMAATAHLYLYYALWWLYVMQRPDAATLVDQTFLVSALPWLLLLTVLAGALCLIGLRLARRRPHSPAFQHLVQHVNSLSLTGLGWTAGIMSLPAGVLIVSTPLVGFIFFQRRYVIGALLSSLALILTLAYASAVGLVPYAPLLPAGTSWQHHTPFWTLSQAFFVLPVVAVVVALADRTLGHWRQRGAQIRAMNRTDPLTRVRNRRHILGFLQRVLAEGREVSVVILDLDHFKRINDTWGHPAGDQVLKQVATRLASALREDDALGRVGGEEFLIVLPDTGLPGARALAERCRGLLRDEPLQLDGGITLRISSSFGVANAPAGLGIAPDTLIARADRALYRAKAKGRDRVETALAPTG